jgi:hypothetical protein
MDDSFRRFVEECDTFQVRPLSLCMAGMRRCDRPHGQGLQLCTDNASFGSFVHSLLTAFRDEYPKRPTLMFAVLSDSIPENLDTEDVRWPSIISTDWLTSPRSADLEKR